MVQWQVLPSVAYHLARQSRSAQQSSAWVRRGRCLTRSRLLLRTWLDCRGGKTFVKAWRFSVRGINFECLACMSITLRGFCFIYTPSNDGRNSFQVYSLVRSECRIFGKTGECRSLSETFHLIRTRTRSNRSLLMIYKPKQALDTKLASSNIRHAVPSANRIEAIYLGPSPKFCTFWHFDNLLCDDCWILSLCENDCVAFYRQRSGYGEREEETEGKRAIYLASTQDMSHVDTLQTKHPT